MGAGASVVAYHFEKMGIEIVEGPAKAAEFEKPLLPFGCAAMSSELGTSVVRDDEIGIDELARVMQRESATNLGCSQS